MQAGWGFGASVTGNDLDGDGYSDIVVASTTNRLFIYRGGPGVFGTMPALQFTMPDSNLVNADRYMLTGGN